MNSHPLPHYFYRRSLGWIWGHPHIFICSAALDNLSHLWRQYPESDPSFDYSNKLYIDRFILARNNHYCKFNNSPQWHIPNNLTDMKKSQIIFQYLGYINECYYHIWNLVSKYHMLHHLCIDNNYLCNWGITLCHFDKRSLICRYHIYSRLDTRCKDLYMDDKKHYYMDLLIRTYL